MTYAHIPEFPAYRVSSLGFIESRWRSGAFYNGFVLMDVLPEVWRRLKENERPDGYRKVDLRDGYGKSRKIYVHALVAELFHGPKPFPLACVRHLDGNPANNAAVNLAWGTYTDNEHDKKNHGTWEARFGGKLSHEDRDAIRRRSVLEKQRDLAVEFGVSRPTITRLINGSTWKDQK